MYPVIFFDALRVKIREDAVVGNKAVYLALGVLPDGTRVPAGRTARDLCDERDIEPTLFPIAAVVR